MGAIRASACEKGFGFAPLNCADSLRSIYCVSVKPPAAKPCAIFPTFAKENNPQKTRVLRSATPLRVFSFALFGLLASGLALGGSPVPRWLVVRCRRCAVAFAVLLFRRCFLCLLWLAFAVRVLCRRRFRRSFRRVFRRLSRLVAVLRLAALPVLTASRCRRLALRVLRFLCFRLRRLGLVVPLLRVVRRLSFPPFPRLALVAVWLLSFLRLVRPRSRRRRLLRAALPVSVRVLGLRLLLPSGAAFRLSFFRVFRLAFHLCRFCPLGLALGFAPVLAFGLPVFVLFLLRPLLCLSKSFLFLHLH